MRGGADRGQPWGMSGERAWGRPRVAVPSRLLGEPVRRNGGDGRARFLHDLGPYVDWLPIRSGSGIGPAADGYVLTGSSARRPAADAVIEDEAGLDDAVLREAFTERIFAHARLRELLRGDWQPRDLVAFQSRHKMQLLAHSPTGYRETGRLVAEAGTRPRAELAAAYGAAFRTAMAARTSAGRNVNVLQHCLGMLGDDLDPADRVGLAEAIASYQEGRVALGVPLALLRHLARGEAAGYVRDQTFLSPYPDELGLR